MLPGSSELIVIGIIIVLLFGAKKLPELARSLGSATSEFKKGQIEAAKETRTSEGEELTKVQKLARDMGIDIQGKTDEELLEEMQKKR